MKKHEAIDLLGGTVSKAAKAMGITPSAIAQWPDDLPGRIFDRVIAAVARNDPKGWPAIWKKLSGETASRSPNSKPELSQQEVA